MNTHIFVEELTFFVFVQIVEWEGRLLGGIRRGHILSIDRLINWDVQPTPKARNNTFYN